MAWFWTDDIARALVDAGVVEQSQVEELIHRPMAVAADATSSLVDLGKTILGLEDGRLETAGAA